MAISSYVSELKQKHANLSDQLERSQRIPSIDSLELKILKLKKLKINLFVLNQKTLLILVLIKYLLVWLLSDVHHKNCRRGKCKVSVDLH